MRRPPAIPPTVTRARPPEIDAQARAAAQKAQAESGPIVAGPIDAGPGPALEQVPGEPVPASVSTRLTERLTELRGARRRAVTRRAAIAGAAAALVALVAWIVFYSPILALDADRVEVNGTNPYVSAADVRATLAERHGTPLARLDTGRISEELISSYAIKGATFVRLWPHGLQVDLDARSAVAAAPREGGFVILDGEGTELGTSAEEVEGLPIVRVAENSDLLAETIAAALEVMDALPAHVLEQVQAVGAKNPDEVEFTLDGGRRVVWGSPVDSELKAATLDVLLQVPAAVYNVTSPLSPITS